MKIFDCFTYFNEDLILEIRLQTLDKFVDKFIIIEAGQDHQGNKKKKNFDINHFSKFKNKINYFYIENLPNLNYSWDRENYQRNYISQCIKEAKTDDLIIISDVDEIPNLEKFEIQKTKSKFIVFEQKMFYYKLNLLLHAQPIWHGSRACKKKYLKSPQWLRSQKPQTKYPFWRFDKVKFDYIKNGGWHFSYLQTPDGIVKKIKSYAHTEYNLPEFTNEKKVEELINKQQDIFGRNLKFEPVKLDKTFPQYILENKIKFQNWIV